MTMSDRLGFDSTDASDVLRGNPRVRFHVEIDGLPSPSDACGLTLSEQLGQTYEAVVDIRVGDHPGSPRELLGADGRVWFESGSATRLVRGVVRHSSVRETHEGTIVTVHIVPALWLLSRNRDSRIFQGMNVVEVVKSVYERMLSSRHRTCRNDTRRQYPTYEYIVQYQESDHDFICRLLEREGIFFYFDHDAENEQHEVLVLADDVPSLADVNGRGGVVSYAPSGLGGAWTEESISHVGHAEEVGATASIVRGFDWTHPTLAVEDKSGGPDGSPFVELYEHGSEARTYDYGSESYRANTVSQAARRTAERAALARQRWVMSGSVVGAMPGTIIEVMGSEADGKYLVIGNDARGTATEGVGGNYYNELECVPVDQPYCPPRLTPEPRVLGPETAIVVGPAGEEIHTDEHGRVKVQMHWDRQGRRDEHSSCWMRVTQGWAGPGWGMMFIPRIGMEVMVSFLGGDPDRPVITGCLYNGDNRPPYGLPANKTRSTIKTNSSLGSNGYNELRFEDLAGEEEVFLHAQKDFNEVVEHNHTTRVKNCQWNTVDVHQTETIGRNQTMHVKGERKKVVDEDEHTTIVGSRDELVKKDERVTIERHRDHGILGNDTLTVHAKRTVVVSGGQRTKIGGDRHSWVEAHDNLTVTAQYNVSVGEHWKAECGSSQLYMDGSQFFGAMSTMIQWKIVGGTSHLQMQVGGIVLLKGESLVCAESGASKIKLTPAGIEIEGPTVTINGQNLVDIQSGGLVKIKSP